MKISAVKTSKAKPSIILLLFFITVGRFMTNSNAQHFNSIRVIKEGEQLKRKIEFYGINSDKPIRTLYATDLNPFSKLNAAIVENRDRYNTPIYELDTVNQLKLIDKIDLVSNLYHLSTKKLVPFRLLSRYSIYNPNNNYISILYELNVLNDIGQNISSHTQILILDKHGNLVKKTPVWPVNGNHSIVSEDSRFVLFKCGGPYDWEQQGYIPNMLWVYDTEKDQIFIDSDVDLGRGIDLIGGTLFNTSIFYGNRSTDIILYDFYNRIKYKKNIPIEEMSTYVAIKPSGLTFRDVNGNIYLKYTFERDFIKSDIIFLK